MEKSIEIVEIYDSVISAPYIDYSLDNPPIYLFFSYNHQFYLIHIILII